MYLFNFNYLYIIMDFDQNLFFREWLFFTNKYTIYIYENFRVPHI